MEFFRPGIDIDWMGRRRAFLTISTVVSLCGLLGMFWPGPNWGTDFEGGTEMQVRFRKNLDIATLRRSVAKLGHGTPEVVPVAGSRREYLIRVQAVSPVAPQKAKVARRRLQTDLGATKIFTFRLSPGGDKLALQLSEAVEPERLQESLARAGLSVRSAQSFGKPEEHRYEVFLVGIAEAIMASLRAELGERVVPAAAERADWVGPKAGAQLRDAGIKSLLYALLLMGIYIAFRFDLRFAPGALFAVVHDVAFGLLAIVILRVEVTLATIAAVLTIVGYSINDTIIIYDRIRENLAKMRDADLAKTINVSVNETLGRTINTVLTTQISVIAIIVFTRGNVREFAITLFFGFLAGVYSTVFVASPITLWLDAKFFRRQSA